MGELSEDALGEVRCYYRKKRKRKKEKPKKNQCASNKKDGKRETKTKLWKV